MLSGLGRGHEKGEGTRGERSKTFPSFFLEGTLLTTSFHGVHMMHRTFLRYVKITAIFSLLSCFFIPVALAGEAEVLTVLNTDSGLSGNRVNGLAPDRGFGIFIATDGGLHVFVDYVYLPIFQKIEAYMIAGGLENTLWALIDEPSLYRVRTDNEMWLAERIPRPEGSKEVTALASLSDTLFIATDTGLSCIADTDDTYHPVLTDDSAVTAMITAAEGTLAVAMTDTESGAPGLKILGGEIFGRRGWVPELFNHEITSLWLAPNALFAGTKEGELIRIDRENAVRVYLSPDTLRALFPGRINDIMVDEDRLYVAAENGLYAGDADADNIDIVFDGDAPLEGAFTCLSPGPGFSIWAGTHDDGVYLITYRE